MRACGFMLSFHCFRPNDGPFGNSIFGRFLDADIIDDLSLKYFELTHVSFIDARTHTSNGVSRKARSLFFPDMDNEIASPHAHVDHHRRNVGEGFVHVKR